MSKWADDLRQTEDIIRAMYRDEEPRDMPKLQALMSAPDAWAETDTINAAADFINDATRDLPNDTFAAVLQAAIARRD